MRVFTVLGFLTEIVLHVPDLYVANSGQCFYGNDTDGGPPIITAQPTSQAVAAGEFPAFIVVAEGAQPLSYQWKKNNIEIPGATETLFIVISATVADAGSYKVVVSNPQGMVTSAAVTVTVNGKSGPSA